MSTKKIWPRKAHALSLAKLSHGSQLVTAHWEVKRLLLKEYTIWLTPRPLLASLNNLKSM